METPYNYKETLLKSAELYLSLGWSVIPIDGKSKIPTIEWKKYQSEHPSIETVISWLEQPTTSGLGIVTGSISGIVVLDAELGAPVDDLLPLNVATVKTGGGGYHFYFEHTGEKIPNAVRFRDRMDVRGDGGYVAAPPTVHKSGKQYEWLKSPLLSGSEALPEVIQKQLSLKKKETDGKWREYLSGVSIGYRHDSAAKIIGKLLFHLPMVMWDEVIPGYMVGVWNEKNSKKHSEADLMRIYKDLTAKNAPEKKAADDFREDFKVEKIKKINDYLFIESSYGPIKMTAKNFLTQRYFAEDVFSCTSKILPPFDKKQWFIIQKEWCDMIEENKDDSDISLTSAVEEALDDLRDLAREGDVDILRKGIPVITDDGILFKLKTIHSLLSQEKGMQFTRPEIVKSIKDCGCTPRFINKKIRAWLYPCIVEKE